MDSKYGRLFTEKDVRDLMEAAIEAALDEEDLTAAQVADGVLIAAERWDGERALKFPAHEPLFLLRAHDELAGPAVATYWGGILARDVTKEVSERVLAALNAFYSYKDANPGSMRLASS